jgi:hypothetical protein
MKENTELLIYVEYMVYIFFKRIYDLYISVKYPQETNTDTKFAYFLIKLRVLLAYISITWLLLMLIFFRLNTTMRLFLYVILSSILFYLLIEQQYIYFFIDKTDASEHTKEIILDLETHGAIIVNIIWFSMYFYVMYKIFPMAFNKLV